MFKILLLNDGDNARTYQIIVLGSANHPTICKVTILSKTI